MNYVYRYTDKEDGIIKYVGIVCRDSENALMNRIKEHANNDKWCVGKTWKIEYIIVPTKNDAHSLESHFIELYGTKRWFNRAKTKLGILTYYKEKPEWRLFEDNYFVKQKQIVENERIGGILVSVTRIPDIIAKNMGNIRLSILIIGDMLKDEDYSLYSKEELLRDKEELENAMKEYEDFFDKQKLNLA